ncbi:MAG: hypothetical protein AB8U25_02535 [Rickettsiales endosymbiont of Dermacentor nuttalli]
MDNPNKSQKFSFLQKLPKELITKIFSYNVFIDNINKFVANHIALKKEFVQAIVNDKTEIIQSIINNHQKHS